MNPKSLEAIVEYFKSQGAQVGMTAESARLLESLGLLDDAKELVPVRDPAKDTSEDLEVLVTCCKEGEIEWGPVVHTTCAVCNTGIFHSPEAPAKGTKVCMDCAIILVQKQSD